jgi:hypothetical protein
MVNSNKKVEADRRRFDIGSGIQLEPLDSTTLEFVFHPRVANKLLGAYSGLTFDPNNTDTNKIYWNKKYGVGTKGRTHEIIFLGASSTDKVAIKKIIAQHGNIESVLDLAGVPDAEDSVNYEFINGKIDRAVSEIGRLIKLAVAHDYNTVGRFVDEVITKRIVRLMAMNTVDTGQAKIVAFSSKVGINAEPWPDSHPNMITVEDANKLTTKDYPEPFSAQRRLRDLLYD